MAFTSHLRAGLGRFALLRLYVFDGDPGAVAGTTLNTSGLRVSTPGASARGGGVTPAWDRGGLDERRVVAARLSA
ncbi:hypothetical protein [Streptomyces canus]|uniref:hypothetical protein n=1 Tax=Streptomyces canus TaxID=58343 RepID=UPI0036E5EC2F